MAGPSRPRFTGWLTMAPESDTKPLPSGSTSSAAFEASVSPKASTHGLSFVGAAATAPARRKKGATFQIGPFDSFDEDKSHSASGSTSSSPLSDVSDPPPFDVRTSFAPMPEYGRVKQQQAQEDDSDGIVFAGRQWKGKTVHAVEQEMEELRDESLMSHAPDATYLASRLEGLRRNLEVEEYKPNYIEYDDDSGSPSSSVTEDGGRRALPIAIAASPLRTMSMDMDAVPALSRPVSNASSTSLAEGVTPQDTTLEFGFDFGDDEEAGSTRVAAIDPAAKAAALDARIEMRPLRRNDLEQVRDLHTLHGDGDTVSCRKKASWTSAGTSDDLDGYLLQARSACPSAVAVPAPLFGGLATAAPALSWSPSEGD